MADADCEEVGGVQATGLAGGGLGGIYPNPTVENLTVPLRNETGSPIPKGTLVAASGFSTGRITVITADKDSGPTRPAIAVTTAVISNNTNFEGLVSGTLTGMNTSFIDY